LTESLKTAKQKLNFKSGKIQKTFLSKIAETPLTVLQLSG